MEIEAMYEHIFLKAADLNGKDVVLTIDKVQREAATNRQGKQAAVVIYFVEVKPKAVEMPDAITGKPDSVMQEAKKLWCNITNGRTIAKLHGKNIDEWHGKKITLYPTTTRGTGGTVVDCIRVREK